MQPKSQFLILSRGQWDKDVSPEEIQKAIDEFYLWLLRLVDEGKMKTGQRLGTDGRTVSGKGFITDGPFGEAKEVVGGYWTVLADNLDEAAQIASSSPCLKCGLFYEIRPFVSEQATADTVTNETPAEWRKKR